MLASFQSRRKPTKRQTTRGTATGTEYLLFVSILCNVALLGWVIIASLYYYNTNGNPLLQQQTIQWNGGHPLDQKSGTCYCNAAQYCMCTPSLAIDLVILSGNNDHVWLVRRKDTNQLATMGGFVQVGETVETAVQRELMEEMNVALTEPPVLLGVYSDPRRDSRRHTVSAVYAVRVDDARAHPVAADDAKEVHRIPLDDIEQFAFFADHKTILMDFRATLQRHEQVSENHQVHGGNFANDIVRSLCRSKDAEWLMG